MPVFAFDSKKNILLIRDTKKSDVVKELLNLEIKYIGGIMKDDKNNFHIVFYKSEENLSRESYPYAFCLSEFRSRKEKTNTEKEKFIHFPNFPFSLSDTYELIWDCENDFTNLDEKGKYYLKGFTLDEELDICLNLLDLEKNSTDDTLFKIIKKSVALEILACTSPCLNQEKLFTDYSLKNNLIGKFFEPREQFYSFFMSTFIFKFIDEIGIWFSSGDCDGSSITVDILIPKIFSSTELTHVIKKYTYASGSLGLVHPTKKNFNKDHCGILFFSKNYFPKTEDQFKKISFVYDEKTFNKIIMDNLIVFENNANINETLLSYFKTKKENSEEFCLNDIIIRLDNDTELEISADGFSYTNFFLPDVFYFRNVSLKDQISALKATITEFKTPESLFDICLEKSIPRVYQKTREKIISIYFGTKTKSFEKPEKIDLDDEE